MGGPTSHAMDCPECAKPATIQHETKPVKLLGKVQTSLLTCRHCGLSLRDAVTDGEEKARAFSMIIEEKKDLAATLVKSSTGTVKIPQLGIRYGPKEGAQGMLTTVSGLLEQFKANARKVASTKVRPDTDPLDQQALARAAIKRIENVMNGTVPFEIVVEDPYGNSALAGPKVREAALSPQDLERLNAQIQQMEF